MVSTALRSVLSRPWTSAACVLGLIALSVWLLLPLFPAQVDRWLTDLQRSNYRTLYRLGLALPGTPALDRLDERLARAGLKLGMPVLVRIFKRESELELWMRQGDSFKLFATYPVCRWAGTLGPKLTRGDRQVPEGFYTVGDGQLNPNSRWHRSFNVGYPNRLDKMFGRTGDYIMVHGGCSSAGCIAVTNEVVDEVWQLVSSALASGQSRFQAQIYPFRMTTSNLALYAGSRWRDGWQDLQQGYALFESNHVPPVPTICNRRYAFAAGKPGSDGSGELRVGCAGNIAARD